MYVEGGGPFRLRLDPGLRYVEGGLYSLVEALHLLSAGGLQPVTMSCQSQDY